MLQGYGGKSVCLSRRAVLSHQYRVASVALRNLSCLHSFRPPDVRVATSDEKGKVSAEDFITGSVIRNGPELVKEKDRYSGVKLRKISNFDETCFSPHLQAGNSFVGKFESILCFRYFIACGET
jgi:hypothetical protein